MGDGASPYPLPGISKNNNQNLFQKQKGSIPSHSYKSSNEPQRQSSNTLTPNYEEKRSAISKKNYLSDREVAEPVQSKPKINSLILSDEEEASFNRKLKKNESLSKLNNSSIVARPSN